MVAASKVIFQWIFKIWFFIYNTFNWKNKLYFDAFRVNPPTDAELKQNLAIMHMKKVNAAEIDSKFSKGKEEEPIQITTGMPDFPKYDEYERVVGSGKTGNKE